MRVRLKLPVIMWDAIQADLHRRHKFAYERVGFMTAGVALAGPGHLLVLAREYRPVDDGDYVPDPTVGVKIGSEAMRKAAQMAYKARSALFHIHTHGGRGRPGFSDVDLRSGAEFVPGFFHSVPRMAHGMLVLSGDSAAGLIWLAPEKAAESITDFVTVGAVLRKFGARA